MFVAFWTSETNFPQKPTRVKAQVLKDRLAKLCKTKIETLDESLNMYPRTLKNDGGPQHSFCPGISLTAVDLGLMSVLPPSWHGIGTEDNELLYPGIMEKDG